MVHIPDELDLGLWFGSMSVTNQRNRQSGNVILLYGEYCVPDEEGREAIKSKVSTETDDLVDDFASSYALAFIKENCDGVYDRVIDREAPEEKNGGYVRTCYYIFAENRLGFSSEQMWEICSFFINKIPMEEINIKYAEEYLNKKQIFWEGKREPAKLSKKERNFYILPSLSDAWRLPPGSVVYEKEDGKFVCETSFVADDFFSLYKGKKERLRPLIKDTKVLFNNSMEGE